MDYLLKMGGQVGGKRSLANHAHYPAQCIMASISSGPTGWPLFRDIFGGMAAFIVGNPVDRLGDSPERIEMQPYRAMLWAQSFSQPVDELFWACASKQTGN